MAKNFLEKIFSAPSRALKEVVETSEKFGQKVSREKTVKQAQKYWHILGPGLTTGAADDDPSGIATYSQAGAKYGFGLLWLAPFTFPLMAVVQEMCARIGIVTGKGLAANIRKHYPKSVLYLVAALLFFANTFNIGADLGAMAKATQLIFPAARFGLLVAFLAAFSLGLQIFMPYKKYARYLKWLSLILFSYVLAAFAVEMNWRQFFLHTFVPSFQFSSEQIFLVTAVLGTTISPYLFFWQTSQEVEEEIQAGKKNISARQGATKEEIGKMRVDVWSGMFISNLVMLFIIAVCGATLFTHGVTEIATAADAASALRPLAGGVAYLLFALGIIGTGFLAVPVLAGSASYALAESFGWKEGLYRKLKTAYPFYGVIIVSMIIGLALNFFKLDPIRALIYSAVINGIIAPLILILIVSISSNRKIMGERTNHPTTQILGWVITIFLLMMGAATIITKLL